MASNSSNSSNNSGRMAVPEAKEAMKRFKEEVASELGVPLKDGYNGDLTSSLKLKRRNISFLPYINLLPYLLLLQRIWNSAVSVF